MKENHIRKVRKSEERKVKNIGKEHVIRYLILVSILIGNPPIFVISRKGPFINDVYIWGKGG